MIGHAAFIRRSMRIAAVGARCDLIATFSALVSWVLACTFDAFVGEGTVVFGVPKFLTALALGELRSLSFDYDFLIAKLGYGKYFLIIMYFFEVYYKAMVSLACEAVFYSADKFDNESQIRQFIFDPISWGVLVKKAYKYLAATFIA